MADWNTRLAVSFTDDKGKVVDITPIDSFTPTFNLNAEVINSIEATHIGVIYQPQNLTFSMTVKAIGDPAAQLTSIALQGRHFDITLQESDGGNDWSFKSIVLSDCIITSAGPSAATVNGAPSATFSGFALGINAAPKTGEAVKFP